MDLYLGLNLANWSMKMKYQHIQRIFKNPFFVNCKKHYCINCGKLLKKVKVSKIVNSNSPEAKFFDFHTVDNFMIGNVKFIWTEFLCSNCKKQFTIDEMRRIEKAQRKMKNEK